MDDEAYADEIIQNFEDDWSENSENASNLTESTEKDDSISSEKSNVNITRI